MSFTVLIKLWLLIVDSAKDACRVYSRNYGCSYFHLQHNFSTLAIQLKFASPSSHLIQFRSLVIRCSHPQNADFPRYHSKKEKKPFPIPIVELRRAARERLKNSKGQQRRGVPPPKRGLVVQRLIPVAYRVFNARVTLINNLKKLLKVSPLHAC